jgi:hypothetical protein
MNLERTLGSRLRCMVALAAALGATALVLAAATPEAHADWGMLPVPQNASNVSFDRHGNWMVVSFDLDYATALPYVTLTPYGGGAVKFGFGNATPKTHWEIPVANLTPNTIYLADIYMKNNNGVTKKYLAGAPKTLQRNVDVTYRWVRVHETSDNGCGEFVFDFAASGGFVGLANAPRLPNTLGGSAGAFSSAGVWLKGICAGESWDPPNETISLFDTGNTVATSVVGVDDDRDWFDFGACSSLGFGGCKNIGDWAEGSLELDVRPDGVICCEEYTKHASYLASQAVAGDPAFTWYVMYTVSYTE